MRHLQLIVALGLVAASNGLSQGIYPAYDFAVAVIGLTREAGIKEVVIPVSVPLPEYPSEMVRAGIAGEAAVRFLVQEDGSVTEVEFTRISQSEFRRPVREALLQWRFQIYAPNGTTKIQKKVWMKCRIAFRRDEE